MNRISTIAVLSLLVVVAGPLSAQARPDFSGVWRLDVGESRMIGGGGPTSDEYQLTWLVNHRDPEISVVVNVRDSQGSHEFSFRCTTDGRECVNELASLREVRRMSAAWEGNVLVMSQRANTPHGNLEARDRLSLTDAGERLVFERVVTNEHGDRSVRQVFRKLGPTRPSGLRRKVFLRSSCLLSSTACFATTSSIGTRGTRTRLLTSLRMTASSLDEVAGSAGKPDYETRFKVPRATFVCVPWHTPSIRGSAIS